MERLIHILHDLHPDIDFSAESSLIDHGILDSFDIVTIVAEVDDVFDVRIPVEELIPDNFNSASSLFSLIQRLSNY